MKIRTHRNSGFTLIELMIVVAIIAIVAAVAIPKLMSARISANENAAVATLRSIAAAQQQFQSSCSIDTDADGGGEFAFFGELSGMAAMRVYEPISGLPALGTAPDDFLDPPFLATAFGNLVADTTSEGIIERQGYFFKIYLPGPTASAVTPGMGEISTGGAKSADMGVNWGSANCEIYWCAYAWPVDTEKTGNRVFMVNQEGDIIQFANRDVTYGGSTSVPTFGAAYSDATANNMEEDLGLSVMGFASNDANVWTAVGN
jgi:prepilin-type N-terminal cleavage/methylation domain-containing protein